MGFEDKIQKIIYEGFEFIPDQMSISEVDGCKQVSFNFDKHKIRLIVGFKKDVPMIDYLCSEMQTGFGTWDLNEFHKLGFVSFIREIPM